MIAGDHVGLRAIEPADLERLRDWRNRPQFRRNFREHREIGSEHQRRWYEKVVVADPATLMFSIVDIESGRLLGAAGLCSIDWVNRNCDLSIYIGHEDVYVDDRYASDAARVLLRYAFMELAIHRVWAEIYDYDEVKMQFLERLGFQLEGRHRQHHFADGSWHDSLFYGLLESEFAG